MWYVAQVKTGTEESVRKQYIRMFGESEREQCFIPRYEQMKRYRGEWHKKQEILFPGYVFMISDSLDELSGRLKRVIGLTKLLGTDGEVIPLVDEETEFVKRLGGKDHVVAMSTGIVAGTQVIITDGPLKGWAGLIRKVDRHKRKAWLEVRMFGRMQRVEVGLEIVEKRQEAETQQTAKGNRQRKTTDSRWL